MAQRNEEISDKISPPFTQNYISPREEVDLSSQLKLLTEVIGTLTDRMTEHAKKRSPSPPVESPKSRYGSPVLPEFYPDDFIRRNRNARRESIYNRLSMNHSGGNINVVTPSIHRTQPPYNHIKLTKLDIDEILKFFDDIAIYQADTNISLKINTLIHGDARELLNASTIDVGYMSDMEFNNLTKEEILVLIENSVRPRSRHQFIKMLKKPIHIEGSEKIYVSITNFEAIYRCYTIYSARFMKRFEFLVGKDLNDNDFIPECHNQANGLIKIYLSGLKNFPFYDFIMQIVDSIPSRIMKSFSTNEDGFLQFLSTIKRQFKTDYEKSLETKEFYERLGGRCC
jgi:hypothetical protein